MKNLYKKQASQGFMKTINTDKNGFTLKYVKVDNHKIN